MMKNIFFKSWCSMHRAYGTLFIRSAMITGLKSGVTKLYEPPALILNWSISHRRGKKEKMRCRKKAIEW